MPRKNANHCKARYCGSERKHFVFGKWKVENLPWSCERKNCVYLIRCTVCVALHTIYVGYTQRIIQKRATNHRNDESLLHEHFLYFHPEVVDQEKHIELYVLEHHEKKESGVMCEQQVRQRLQAEAETSELHLNLLSKIMN